MFINKAPFVCEPKSAIPLMVKANHSATANTQFDFPDLGGNPVLGYRLIDVHYVSSFV